MDKNKGENPSVAFLTLGCKVNSYETDAMELKFRQAGYQIKDFHDRADIYVINTCTVTNIADRKSRQMLHRAKKLNPEALVVAAGCYVQAAGEELLKDTSIDLIVGNNQKQHIVSLVEECRSRGQNMGCLLDMGQEKEYEPLHIDDAGEKTRAYIKIQDGCNQFCSYCIIPYARGRIRSREEADIVEEVSGLVRKGYREIVLTGIHLSSYGVERGEENALLSLIVTLSGIENLERIRLGSLEPRIITPEFVNTLKNDTKFCPHFHLSLQSGCDETLRRMNRKYTTEEYLHKCEMIREAFCLPAITTDVIAGFPGETKEEFAATEAFLEKAAFAQMHIFKYSRRKGTRADIMPDQVPEEIKAERSSRLLSLEKRLREEYERMFIGRKERVLLEEETEIDGKRYMTGHNERYIKIAVPAGTGSSGEIVEVTVTGVLGEGVMEGRMKNE
ncbi:tRNA (N(6)-L-threonylcarbamoyladenosine(37)-C(2))-methylthiotransferase MtaB [Anaerolentibacter hominis]|uniref:tRNA (N(6)-L-threonylcarbamoyladenosine(37)-C(2))- methylthiotransferase MtaB n=1 Tax=Anaerolentibacter hominis TaxID=3079009 RepID=UPI0031B81B3D